MDTVFENTQLSLLPLQLAAT